MEDKERLKQQVEILEKENAILKAKIGDLRLRCKPEAREYFDREMYGILHIDVLRSRT